LLGVTEPSDERLQTRGQPEAVDGVRLLHLEGLHDASEGAQLVAHRRGWHRGELAHRSVHVRGRKGIQERDDEASLESLELLRPQELQQIVLVEVQLLVSGEDSTLLGRHHVSLVRVVVEVAIKEVVNEAQVLHAEGAQRIAVTVRAMNMLWSLRERLGWGLPRETSEHLQQHISETQLCKADLYFNFSPSCENEQWRY
jgi:hypothetical protein